MWSDNPGEIYAGSEHPEGELAAFALNALDDAEFQAVFHHVIRCPHCQEGCWGSRRRRRGLRPRPRQQSCRLG